MADPFGQNSIQNFMSHMQVNPPAYSSLYHVDFTKLPTVLNNKNIAIFRLGDTTLSKNLTYYANEISIPSRQITTGEVKTVGAMYRYPTSTTFSEISMQFTLTRDMLTRTFFERWMNYISNDANQYVFPYDECVIPEVNIYKLERGGGAPVAKAGVLPGTQYNQVTALWKLYNVFPFNISSFNLSNAQSNVINMEVTFYYERYRFFQGNGVPFKSDIDGATSFVPNSEIPPGNFNLDAVNNLKFNPAAFNSGYTFTDPIPPLSGFTLGTSQNIA